MQENNKIKIRERILSLLRKQNEEERLAKSLIIQNKLFMLQEIKDSDTILFYASFDGEVETFEMIKKALQLGKKVALPKISIGNKEIIPKLVDHIETDLEMGPYGIKQPKEELISVESQKIDTVIVPAVAFDKKNNRLGRGGGYYDRFLRLLPEYTSKIGLAFDFQILDTLPTEGHDLPVLKVLVN